jgi:quercetin dioxygenase-like cupin family protein
MRPTVVIDPKNIDWQPAPADMNPGAMLKVLSVDEKTGACAALVKFPAGYIESKHGHPCGHDIYMVQGSLTDTVTGKKTDKGQYFYAPAGNIHGPFAAPKDEDCIFFMVTDAPAFPLVKP